MRLEALALVRIGETEPERVEDLAEGLKPVLRVPVRVEAKVLDPEFAFQSTRGQYDSRKLLTALRGVAHHENEAVLGIADVDLFASIFTFVFGEAHLGGCSALVSIHRLRPEMYGLPADTDLLTQRLLTESVHEIGHLQGAIHCQVPGCVMNFSGAVEEIDLKTPVPCDRCAEHFVGNAGCTDS